MMRALKYLSLIGAGLIVVVLAVAYISLNVLVKKAIQTLGPQITKTSVTLDSASLLPFEGSGGLYGLAIANPAGYKAANAIEVAHIHVALQPKSLLSDVIVVKRIEVIDPEIHYEGTFADSNLTRLQKNVESFTGPSKKIAGPPAPAKKVIIDDFSVRGGKVTIDIRFLAQAKPLVVNLPDIHLTGIGRKSNGASIKEAATEMFGSITGGVAGAASGALKNLTQGIGNVGKNLTGAGVGIGKSLGGLFGKKK